MDTKRIYMCMSVRGAIRNLQGQRSKRTGFTDDKGRPLSKAEAIDALMDELAKGHEVMPMSPKCGNPCGHSDKCPGFNYGKEMGGCPGYECDEDPAPNGAAANPASVLREKDGGCIVNKFDQRLLRAALDSNGGGIDPDLYSLASRNRLMKAGLIQWKPNRRGYHAGLKSLLTITAAGKDALQNIAKESK